MFYYVHNITKEKFSSELYASMGRSPYKKDFLHTVKINGEWTERMDLPPDGYPYGAESGKSKMDIYEFIEEYCIKNPELVIRIENISKESENFSPFLDINSVLRDKFPHLNIDLEKYLNFINRYVKPWATENGKKESDFPIGFEKCVELSMLPKDKINMDLVISSYHEIGEYRTEYTSYILDEIIVNSTIKQSDSSEFIRTAIANNPAKYAEYKAGKTNLLNMFFGEVMKLVPVKNIDKGILRKQLEDILNE